MNDQVSNAEFLAAFQVLAETITAQVNREVVSPMDLNASMDATRIMTYVEQVGNDNLKLKNRESKRLMTDDSEFSRAKSRSGGCSHFLQRYSGQGYSNATTLRFDKYRVTSPKPQGSAPIGQVTPVCKKCGRNHKGECLDRLNVCYRYGKMSYHAKDCKSKDVQPQGQVAQGGQVQAKGGQRINRFYALHGNYEVEEMCDVVTSILQVFHYDVYVCYI
ncbi:uncharacterized protein LOC129890572 [Solanum dulcamara]|uniref:uncharacterized protein LOC129890572 n=1 Tax=Solanum dulcamara TaxID=45834 RepID=UPI00248692A3|nr:uncharacterized protein LOC129890572 [Solanum dulcamara]